MAFSSRAKQLYFILEKYSFDIFSLFRSRLSTFFENLGWKVYRVPETANVLLSGGVNFGEMNEESAEKFQENLLLTMMQVENTFFDLAKATDR